MAPLLYDRKEKHVCLKLLVFYVTISNLFQLGFSYVPWTPLLSPATALFAKTTTSLDEIFVLSFDGVLAHTSRWRAHMGLAVAFQTWPFLKTEERYTNLISFDEQEGQNWIINKMMALSHVLRSDCDAMMGCDEVLLARMLLEEQALDRGRSDALGKYGSQFHPRKSYPSSYNRNGSRPLTVGEISANWIEGACLRETIRTKYSIQRRDPIPIIRENILTFLKEKNTNHVLPEINSILSDLLTNCDNKVFILAGHPSHVPFVSTCLSQRLKPSSVITSIQDVSQSSSLVHIVGMNDDHSNIIRDLIQMQPNGSLFYVVHSSLTVLKKLKLTILSDDSPIGYSYTTSFPCVRLDQVQDSLMKLCLPQFSESVSHKQLNDAEMDPWLNVVGEDELSELLSARIISVGENNKH